MSKRRDFFKYCLKNKVPNAMNCDSAVSDTEEDETLPDIVEDQPDHQADVFVSAQEQSLKRKKISRKRKGRQPKALGAKTKKKKMSTTAESSEQLSGRLSDKTMTFDEAMALFDPLEKFLNMGEKATRNVITKGTEKHQINVSNDVILISSDDEEASGAADFTSTKLSEQEIMQCVKDTNNASYDIKPSTLSDTATQLVTTDKDDDELKHFSNVVVQSLASQETQPDRQTEENMIMGNNSLGEAVKEDLVSTRRHFVHKHIQLLLDGKGQEEIPDLTTNDSDFSDNEGCISQRRPLLHLNEEQPDKRLGGLCEVFLQAMEAVDRIPEHFLKHMYIRTNSTGHVEKSNLALGKVALDLSLSLKEKCKGITRYCTSYLKDVNEYVVSIKEQEYDIVKDSNEDSSTWHCKMCHRIFPNKEELIAHMNIHISGGYNCAICLKVFYSATSLDLHKSFHAPKFRCNNCGENFNFHSEITTHLKVNEEQDGKTYQCEICHQSEFKNCHSMGVHKLKHMKVKDELAEL